MGVHSLTQHEILAAVFSGHMYSVILPLCTSCIWTDNNAVLDVQVLANPPKSARFRVEVVHGHIEEALNLAGVEVHCDDVVATGSLKHVCHKFCCDWRARLVLLILAGIREVWDYSSNAASGSRFARINHNQQLHERIVDVAWRCRLQDENCVVVS